MLSRNKSGFYRVRKVVAEVESNSTFLLQDSLDSSMVKAQHRYSGRSAAMLHNSLHVFAVRFTRLPLGAKSTAKSEERRVLTP